MLDLKRVREDLQGTINRLETRGGDFSYLNKITKIKAQNIKIDNIFKNEENSIDFSDVRGHENIKRALEVAVAGLHGVLMIGGPRITGKQC